MKKGKGERARVGSHVKVESKRKERGKTYADATISQMVSVLTEDKQLVSLKAERLGSGTKAAVRADKKQTVNIIFTSHGLTETVILKVLRSVIFALPCYDKNTQKLYKCGPKSHALLLITENFLHDL